MLRIIVWACRISVETEGTTCSQSFMVGDYYSLYVRRISERVLWDWKSMCERQSSQREREREVQAFTHIYRQWVVGDACAQSVSFCVVGVLSTEAGTLPVSLVAVCLVIGHQQRSCVSLLIRLWAHTRIGFKGAIQDQQPLGDTGQVPCRPLLLIAAGVRREEPQSSSE